MTTTNYFFGPLRGDYRITSIAQRLNVLRELGWEDHSEIVTFLSALGLSNIPTSANLTSINQQLAKLDPLENIADEIKEFFDHYLQENPAVRIVANSAYADAIDYMANGTGNPFYWGTLATLTDTTVPYDVSDLGSSWHKFIGLGPFNAEPKDLVTLRDAVAGNVPILRIHPNETGAVLRVNVTNSGSGYALATTTVTISGGGGSGATATPTIENGEITAITVTNVGSGHTTIPTVTITDGALTNPGTGATAVAVLTCRFQFNQFVESTPSGGTQRVTRHHLDLGAGVAAGVEHGRAWVLQDFPAAAENLGRARSVEIPVRLGNQYDSTIVITEIPVGNESQEERTVQVYTPATNVNFRYTLTAGTGGQTQPTLTVRSSTGFQVAYQDASEFQDYNLPAATPRQDNWLDLEDDGSPIEAATDTDDWRMLWTSWADPANSHELELTAVLERAGTIYEGDVIRHIRWPLTSHFPDAITFGARFTHASTTEHLSGIELAELIENEYQTQWFWGKVRQVEVQEREFSADIDIPKLTVSQYHVLQELLRLTQDIAALEVDEGVTGQLAPYISLIKDFFSQYSAPREGQDTIEENPAFERVFDGLANALADGEDPYTRTSESVTFNLGDASNNARVQNLGESWRKIIGIRMTNTVGAWMWALDGATQVELIRTQAGTAPNTVKLQINDYQQASQGPTTPHTVSSAITPTTQGNAQRFQLFGFPTTADADGRTRILTLNLSLSEGQPHPWIRQVALGLPVTNVSQERRVHTIDIGASDTIYVGYTVTAGASDPYVDVTVHGISIDADNYDWSVISASQRNTYTSSTIIAATDNWNDLLLADGTVWESTAGNQTYLLILGGDPVGGGDNGVTFDAGIRDTASGNTVAIFQDPIVHWVGHLSADDLYYAFGAGFAVASVSGNLTDQELFALADDHYLQKWLFGLDRLITVGTRSFTGRISLPNTEDTEAIQEEDRFKLSLVEQPVNQPATATAVATADGVTMGVSDDKDTVPSIWGLNFTLDGSTWVFIRQTAAAVDANPISAFALRAEETPHRLIALNVERVTSPPGSAVGDRHYRVIGRVSAENAIVRVVKLTDAQTPRIPASSLEGVLHSHVGGFDDQVEELIADGFGPSLYGWGGNENPTILTQQGPKLLDIRQTGVTSAAWSASLFYNAGTYVTYNGSLWRCATTHNAGSVPPSSNNTLWVRVSGFQSGGYLLGVENRSGTIANNAFFNAGLRANLETPYENLLADSCMLQVSMKWAQAENWGWNMFMGANNFDPGDHSDINRGIVVYVYTGGTGYIEFKVRGGTGDPPNGQNDITGTGSWSDTANIDSIPYTQAIRVPVTGDGIGDTATAHVISIAHHRGFLVVWVDDLYRGTWVYDPNTHPLRRALSAGTNSGGAFEQGDYAWQPGHYYGIDCNPASNGAGFLCERLVISRPPNQMLHGSLVNL